MIFRSSKSGGNGTKLPIESTNALASVMVSRPFSSAMNFFKSKSGGSVKAPWVARTASCFSSTVISTWGAAAASESRQSLITAGRLVCRLAATRSALASISWEMSKVKVTLMMGNFPLFPLARNLFFLTPHVWLR